jgi:hypothetical protein
MQLQFRTREDYLTERLKIQVLDTVELEILLSQLFEKRYVDQDINYESIYRLVSSVYVHRTRQNRPLIFHAKNFLG